MCNSYRITPKAGLGDALGQAVGEAAARLPTALVRKSDPGVVALAGGQVEVMRWGFWRRFNSAINNTRCDKLGTGMWAAAARERRCVIAASAFYEWGPGAAGIKQAHEFSSPSDDYLWIAGIWEPNEAVGPCYSMVTTSAPPLMAPIHERMPAVLTPAEMDDYLHGEHPWGFRPFDGELLVSRCASPLKRPAAADGQGELF